MGPLVLRAENALLKKHLRRQASRLGLEFGEFTDEKLESPKMLVAELEQPGLLEEVTDWKEKWPECFVAISVSEPDRELWIAAETAGADLVANRGALPRLIHERLKQLVKGQALVKKKMLQKAKPVINQGEGLIGRLPDSSEDPIAVFKWKEQVCAVRDICPHAGFSLADGEFDPESGIVTCPEHGSRFQVCSGERIRGPADYPLKKYRAFESGEEILVEIEQAE
ncbi:MAG: Rieske 2Fe-2S domain-containing protein [SAR324 cluster bacterium]|nr:Rieske 2Fe-2S domain-containing protein [SAR324 cluster bacterium]